MKHLTWFGILATSILFCSTVIAQNGGLKFTLTDLGTIAVGGYQSEAWAINNNGQVVGDYLWTIKRLSGQGCFSKLPGQAAVPFGTSPCSARAVNASGAIAGWMKYGTGTHAFRRDASGTITDLPPVTSGQDSYGYGIDYNGNVVGQESGYGNAQALQWDLGGHATVLYCGNVNVFGAFATNSGGISVAGYCVTTPVLWVFGSPIYLSTLEQSCLFYQKATPYAMNQSNHLVGSSQANSDCFTNPHAVLWGQNYAIVDLGAGAIAYAISSDDWIVGDYYPGPGAFLRVSDPVCPQMVNLNLLLDSSAAGWSVIAANGINDGHQVVGQGLAPNGQYHAILLTPANNLPLCQPD